MNKMNRIRVFFLAVVLLGFVWVAGAQTTPYPLDDFLCYQVVSNDPLFSAAVDLQDDIALLTPTPVTVQTGRDFCNAAELAMGKRRTAIDNAADDLTFYDVIIGAPLGSPRTVQVNNFFGPQTIDISNPTRLAVPTGKVPAPVPTQLDHFLCYTVVSGATIRKRLAVTDLWMRERVLVGFPNLFCNPVEKTDTNGRTFVRHPDDHLVCYVIAEQTFAPNVNVNVNNQFGLQTLGVQSFDLLCVPSTVQTISPARVVEE